MPVVRGRWGRGRPNGRATAVRRGGRSGVRGRGRTRGGNSRSQLEDQRQRLESRKDQLKVL